jgi:uncharacterized Zn-binding protein involved in type VI secretion
MSHIALTGDVTMRGAVVVARPRLLAVACQGDIAVHALFGASLIVTGSTRMQVEWAPVARQGDITATGDVIATGDQRSLAD